MHNTIVKKLCNTKIQSTHIYQLILTWIIYLQTKRFGSTISNELLNAHTPFRANISTLSKCRILLRNHSVRASSIHSAHGLRTPREEITFTAWPKIHSHSQIFRYGQNIFCLPHRHNFSDIFDLCLHWVSVVRAKGAS